ncbi:MAG: AsmA-like C-terminal region-containing protein, partial [bacterium]
MRGLQARVEIRGEANLEHETQSLLVTVRPDLNAGMASLAYAAMANPAIGIGSFVVQTVLRRPLQEIFSYRYQVSGSWADPQVVELIRAAAPPADPGAPI